MEVHNLNLAHARIPAITFLVSAHLSFSMGTSWGVWAMMMPISVPLAMASGMNPFVAAGAVLSGGAFGDHCSPVSDTAVLSSLAANTDHLEHIRTQLPYALATAAIAFLGYIFLGYFVA
jgi:tetracycline resistance efflux pump